MWYSTKACWRKVCGFMRVRSNLVWSMLCPDLGASLWTKIRHNIANSTSAAYSVVPHHHSHAYMPLDLAFESGKTPSIAGSPVHCQNMSHQTKMMSKVLPRMPSCVTFLCVRIPSKPCHSRLPNAPSCSMRLGVLAGMFARLMKT